MMEYGLIGEKLGHSYSKQIHEQLASYVYTPVPLTREEFPHFMEQHDFKAINVTIPYKKDVIPYLDELHPLAEKIGAVNTIVNRNGRLTGYNTDYYGFLYLLREAGIKVEGKKVLVIGNGGVAQPVLVALTELHAGKVIIVKYKSEPNVLTYEEAAKLHSDADIIINTSPVGMYPNTDATPIDLTPYTGLYAAIDLIANPLNTVFLKMAKEKGALTKGGLPMLVAQAKYAVEFFLDTKISDEVIPGIVEIIEGQMHNNIKPGHQ